MNIFFLDRNPQDVPQHYADPHVGKIALECCQMMSTAISQNGGKGPYAPAYQNHPMTLWVGRSVANFMWTCSLTWELTKEHIKRFGTEHDAGKRAYECFEASGVIPQGEFTIPPLCYPENVKELVRQIQGEVDTGASDLWVHKQRIAYALHKSHLRWARAPQPEWVRKVRQASPVLPV